MKATGIVRRIDDLGRVVIPKEIRRTMRIREGDPLEIYTNNDGEVIFKKYSVIGEMSSNATQIADIMSKLSGCAVVIFDRDHVIAVSGVQKKEFNERRVSTALEDYIEHKKIYKSGANENRLLPVEGVEKPAMAAVPILSEGMVIGAVTFLSDENNKQPTSEQMILINAAAMFLGKQVEA